MNWSNVFVYSCPILTFVPVLMNRVGLSKDYGQIKKGLIDWPMANSFIQKNHTSTICSLFGGGGTNSL